MWKVLDEWERLQYGCLPMKKQNAKFIVEEESPKGPFFLLPAKRIANLEYKLAFYEGQLDPLQFENIDLKETVIQLLRSLSINANILRKLIPAENAALRLKIDMASFDQIAVMIAEHWGEMKAAVKRLEQAWAQQQRSAEQFKEQLLRQHQLRVDLEVQLQQSRCKWREQFSTLQAEILRLREEAEAAGHAAQQEKNKAQAIRIAQRRQWEIREHEFGCKQNEYERCISRLTKQMDALKFQFEQGKASLKALYEKNAAEKLAEQAETFTLMLKLKEDEKFKVEREISELRQLQAKELQEREQRAWQLQTCIDLEKQKVQELEDQLYHLREEGKGSKMEYRAMETQLHLIRENYAICQANLLKQEAENDQLAAQLQATIRQYEQKMRVLAETEADKRKLMQSENRRQSLLIAELYQQLEQLKDRLHRMDEEWALKAKQLSEAQKARQSELLQQLQQSQKELQAEKQRSATALAGKQQEKEKLKEYYSKQASKMEKDFQMRKEELLKEVAVKNSNALEKSEEQLIHMRLEMKAQMQRQQQAAIEDQKKLQKEFASQLAQQQANFQAQRLKFQQQLELREGIQHGLRQEIERLGRKVREGDDRLDKQRAAHVREIAKLEGKNAELVLTWQALMDKQLEEFQAVIEEREKQFGRREDEFFEQRQSLMATADKREKDLADFRKNQDKTMREFKQANGVAAMEKKFKEQVNEMKTAAIRKQLEMQASFDRKVRDLTEEFTRDKHELMAYYHDKLTKSEASVEELLIDIGVELHRIDVGKECRDSESEIMETMTRQQKLAHIYQATAAITAFLEQQAEELRAVRQRLRVMEEAVEEQVRLRKEEIESQRTEALGSMQEQLSSALSDLEIQQQHREEEYKQKEANLENQRRKFTESLYEEFQLLSSTHQKDYTKLMFRYNELEQLYEKRPSRPEDIQRIKELRSIQAKLEGDIVIYNRKLDTANEIVEYLNRELENYKEVYDIFGPTGEIGNKTISFNLDAQKMEKYNSLIQKKAREQAMQSPAKEETTKTPTREALVLRTAAPFFQLHRGSHGNSIFEQSMEQEEEEAAILESKERKRSHFSLRKGRQKDKGVLKTEKSVSREKSVELFEKTSTFLKLVTAPPVGEAVREEGGKSRLYRRRRVKRLTTTTGAQNFH